MIKRKRVEGSSVRRVLRLGRGERTDSMTAGFVHRLLKAPDKMAAGIKICAVGEREQPDGTRFTPSDGGAFATKTLGQQRCRRTDRGVGAPVLH